MAKSKVDVYASVLEDRGNYMDAKKLKLQEQFMAEATKTLIKKNIFNGVSIFVNGYTVPSADELRFLMLEYGGVYHNYLYKGKTTYMIASNLPDVKIKQYKNSSMIILKPSWVSDSIEAGKMLDFRPYLLLSDFTKKSRLTFNKNSKEISDECVTTNTNNRENSSIHQDSSSPLVSTKVNSDYPKISKRSKTANDENFLEEFYNNSRLHHISALGATFKQYINVLRSKSTKDFPAKERLKLWKNDGKDVSNEKNSVQPGPCIMHIDMDCFFVSVGLRKHPDMRNQPVVVTHAKGNKVPFANFDSRQAEFSLYEKRNKDKYENPEYKPWYTDISETDSMAEIASCSYEARKFGLKNGMLLGQALKLCPNLRPIPYDFKGYKEVSYALYNHIASYTLDIEAVSCDEMYVDCSGILAYANINALEFATVLRKEIKEITGCPCSTGFGANRLLARLATKKAKPDGQYLVKLCDAKDFIKEFQVSDLPGVGHSITAKLSHIGVKTCEDLQKTPLRQLQQIFGNKCALTLQKYSMGEDDRMLIFCHKRKSVSAEVNYGIRFATSFEVENFLKKLCKEVESRLLAIGSRGKSITLKLMLKDEEAPADTAKFLGHGVCNNVTKTISLLEATSESQIIYREILKVIQNLKTNPSDMRGIGIQISRLEDKIITSTSSGKMDKYVVKVKPEENSNLLTSTLQETKISPYDCCEERSKIFDESEYNVSFSQVDPNYFEALPLNIRDELMRGLKRKKRQVMDNQNMLLDEDTSPRSYVLKVNNIPRLNPLIPTAEISKAISVWVATELCPQKCDVQIISEYLREMTLNKQFESVNFIMNNFQKSISGSKHPDEWKSVYQKINQMIKETVK